MVARDYIRAAAKLSMHNREQIEAASRCGCYQCLQVFSPAEIKEYTDNNDTALCPFCNVDTVLAEGPDLALDREVLQRIRQYWL